MVIDSHIHLKNKENLTEELPDLIEKQHSACIDHAVLIFNPPEMCLWERSKDLISEYQESLSIACAIDFRDEDSIDKLTMDVEEYGVKSLKIHPRLQGIQKEEYPQLVLLARRAKELGIPIIVDGFYWGKNIHAYDGIKCTAYIAERIEPHPIVLAHMGGHRLLEAMLLAKEQRNIFLEVSLTFNYFKGSSLVQDVVYAIKKIGPDRCLYGSDYPDFEMDYSLSEFEKLLYLNSFSEADKENILYKVSGKLFQV